MATMQRKETQMAGTQQLSMSPSAIRSRERRAAAAAKKEGAAKTVAVKTDKPVASKAPTSRKQPTAVPIKLNAAQKRTIGQVMAAVASGFLPIASYVMAHIESAQNSLLWVLVAAALTFSAPTLAEWAKKWCGGSAKAWGFTILLEGVMVFSHTLWLSYAGLAILIAINASNAYQLAARKEVKVEQA